MIAIERANELHERRNNRLHVAALDPAVGRSQRPRQPVDLQMDIALRRVEARSAMTRATSRLTVRSLTMSRALRRVEAALGDDAGDVASDRPLANHEPVRDLGIGMAGAHELETGLSPFGSPSAPSGWRARSHELRQAAGCRS